MSFLYWVCDQHDGIVPAGARMTIIYEGPRENCLLCERTLRPRRGIGWNTARGGVAPEPNKRGRRPISYDDNRFKNIWA